MIQDGYVDIHERMYRRLTGVLEVLKTTAVELQDLVQAKVGTTVFSNAYNRIRQGAVSVQQARRVARVTKVRPPMGLVGGIMLTWVM